jgi:type II secretory pathway pseudopilin PulG
MHASPRQHTYAAYTLIELLVVISIIVVLAGLLVPITGVARRMVNDMKCGHNLQQIGAAIEVYKFNNNDLFPKRLLFAQNDPDAGDPITGDLFHSDGPLKGLNKILLCPRDGQNGTDTNMGRATANWDNLQNVYTPGSSYLYEISSHFLNANQISYFFKDRSTFPAVNSPEATWAGGKHNQIKHGNLTDDKIPVIGASFPPGKFPIVRCFWHHKWTGSARKDAPYKKVKNVSWDLNVFDGSPFWESDANSKISLPNN